MIRPVSGKLVVLVVVVIATLVPALALSTTSLIRANQPPAVTVGAIYPLKTGGDPARDEYDGLNTAMDMVNQAGGVRGRHIQLRLENVRGGDQAPTAVNRLRNHHIHLIVGSESSLVGIPASEAADADHIFYLEAGAVATMMTESGLKDVFRTVTTAQTLGRSAARFAAHTIAPRLHIPVHQLRVAVLYIQDAYGSSVGAAQIAETRQLDMNLVRVLPYDYPGANFPRLVRELKSVHPDVVLVAAYRPDAIRFRRETIRQQLHVGAMIGTSSSFCMMAFAKALGRGAVGLFAADKPDASINARVLNPAARALRHKASLLYRQSFGGKMSGPAVAGFVAGWILFHDILPRAGSLSTRDLRSAALSLNLPFGSEINGAGVYFARSPARDAGQNLRATSVIWQWQHPEKAVIISPSAYATGRARFIPLPILR